jgi:hypothetical protein
MVRTRVALAFAVLSVVLVGGCQGRLNGKYLPVNVPAAVGGLVSYTLKPDGTFIGPMGIEGRYDLKRVYEKGVGRRAGRVDDMLARASIHTHAAIATKLP